LLRTSFFPYSSLNGLAEKLDGDSTSLCFLYSSFYGEAFSLMDFFFIPFFEHSIFLASWRFFSAMIFLSSLHLAPLSLCLFYLSRPSHRSIFFLLLGPPITPPIRTKEGNKTTPTSARFLSFSPCSENENSHLPHPYVGMDSFL